MRLLYAFLFAAAVLYPQSFPSPITSAPAVIYKVNPEYTQEALDAKVSGTATVQVVIGADGVPGELAIKRSLGYGLDEKAIECVRQWRFKPGMRDGMPVSVRATIEVNFRLPA
jgi:TonB family protein